ncbi:unnamed protein product [Urochloa decumbens]|uniref:AAA+ ATPase domain-containing protein n=1 Tax=Urochloa decumbens TaxID=240449 RepID=A0ABC9FC61_9POAL
MPLSSVLASPSYGKAAETYTKAVTVAAAAAGYAVVARTMARELLPDEVRDAARWAASVVRDHILPPRALALTFDAEHTDVALGKYLPFVMAEVEAQRRKDIVLRIFMNTGWSWEGFKHHHPATFDTLAMDPEMKRSLVADLDRFLGWRDYYRRIGKAWKRGYLLYGPPGTGKSSLVAAMANYLRFNLYDLDPSHVPSNRELQQRLVTGMANNRRASPCPACSTSSMSTSGEERIIIFTTNYKDRLDPALLRPGRMDMHICMGFCCWEAFKTLARNYFVLDDHPLFPKIQELLAAMEVTPAEVSEMLLRSEDADVALQGLVEFLQDKEEGTKP